MTPLPDNRRLLQTGLLEALAVPPGRINAADLEDLSQRAAVYATRARGDAELTATPWMRWFPAEAGYCLCVAIRDTSLNDERPLPCRIVYFLRRPRITRHVSWRCFGK